HVRAARTTRGRLLRGRLPRRVGGALGSRLRRASPVRARNPRIEMPEGHTLHRLARLHQERFAGNRVRVSSPQGRFAASASVLDGSVRDRAEAHGKHLFHFYGPERAVHVHLGLYGAFTEADLPTTEPRGQVRMRVVGPTHWTDLRGPTACELLHGDEI